MTGAEFQAAVEALAAKTEDAYSFDRYASWKACCAMLLRRGYTAEQAEAVLRSKWTRWAADASKQIFGRATSKDLSHWMLAQKDLQGQVEKLTKETFA
jgi:hypothetical protein